jgi:CBS domain containing-hemolysin-like protein
MTTFFGIAFEIFVIIALIVTNGFFVAAEFALVKVRASQLRPLAKTGGWRVKFALKATSRLDSALSATQFGITLTSLGLGWVGEPYVAHRLQPLLHWLGVTDESAVSSISFAVAFATITFVHIIFGELGPKSLAIQKSQRISLFTAAPLMMFYYVFFPFIWVINQAANRLLLWAGLQPGAGIEHNFAVEELEYVFSHARHAHPGDALVNKLMVQSLRVRDTTAQQIMLPRDQVIMLSLDQPIAENLRLAQTSGHSRFPVCQGTPDNVKGMLLVREWLWQMQALGPEASFEPLLRPVLEFELKTPIHNMIERFRMARSHLAVVRDAERRLAGIVTFEDVLEEIVGDIRDELDIGLGPIHERKDNWIVVSGNLTMRELQAETGWPFEWLPRETVTAWVLRHRGTLPRRDETVTSGDYRFTPLEVQGDRLRRIRIERAGVSDADPAVA